MRQPPRSLITLAVALGFPMLACALAQEPKEEKEKAAAPGGATTTTTITVKTVVKQDAKKADAQPAEKKVEKRESVKKARGDLLEDAVKTIEKAVEVKAVRVVPAMPLLRFGGAVAARPAEPDLEPLAAQYLPHFLPMAKTELHLLLSITDPTPDQRKAVVADRDRAAKEAAKQYAASQHRIGIFRNTNTYPEPRKLMQDSMLAVAQAHLTPEQYNRYKAEIDRRGDDFKSLAIGNILARIDQDLVLTPDQREKLRESLAKNWNPAWGQSLETFMYGDNFFPMIPDSVVVPVLSPKQKLVWSGTHRNGGTVFAGFGMMQGAEDDLFPADERPPEPKDKDKDKPAGPAGGGPPPAEKKAR